MTQGRTIIAVTERGQTMGTNYYAVKTKPTLEAPIHIGKSSYGWKFLFQEQNEKWVDPPVVWSTYKQVCEWLQEHVVERQEFVILDEYSEIISYDSFIDLVAEKQKTKNPDDFKYSKNIDGYRFTDSEFS